MALGPKKNTPEEIQASKEAEYLIGRLEKYLDNRLELEPQNRARILIFVDEDELIDGIRRLRQITDLYGINAIWDLMEEYKKAGWYHASLLADDYKEPKHLRYSFHFWKS
jgi:hypothetical protein